ncbi:hypothetical protein CLU79DRAFT_728421 [Phycomyces nitens]|nr:hypothetical protein CLU79DRAFT_728421 [Phycomyces nitens]
MEFPIAFAETIHTNDSEALIPAFHPTEFPVLSSLNIKTDSGWHFIQKQEAVDPAPKAVFTHTLTSVTDGENAWERLDYCSPENQGRPLYASIADQAISLPDPKPVTVVHTKPKAKQSIVKTAVNELEDEFDAECYEYQPWDMYKSGHSKGSSRPSGRKTLVRRLGKDKFQELYNLEAEKLFGADASSSTLGKTQPVHDYKSVNRLLFRISHRIQKYPRYVTPKSPREVYQMTGCNFDHNVPLSLPIKLSQAIRCELL